MNNYKKHINKHIEDLRELSINNAIRLFGIREANNIEIDDFWKEAKGVYIELLNQYNKMKK